MSSLQYMREMNVYRADHVCLSVHPCDSARESPKVISEMWYGC